MHSVCLVVVAALLAACGSAPPPASRPAARTTPSPSAAGDRAALLPSGPRPNRCLPEGPPKALADEPRASMGTCVDHRRSETAIARKIAARFERTLKGSRVEVAFDCDPVTSSIEEVVVEIGAGHGGSLVLWRFFRSGGEGDFRVVGIAHDEPWEPYDSYTYETADRFKVAIATGVLSASRLEKAAEPARAALTAMVRELEPPPLPNAVNGVGFSIGSGDFHDLVRFRDGTHVLERAFTGYPGTQSQARYLGVQIAMEALLPLVERITFETRAPGDEERSFFLRELSSVRARLDDEGAWWVRERYVRLAGRIGAREVVPFLVGELRRGLREVQRANAANRASTIERVLTDPIVALARATGWDIRRDAGGVERPREEVAREYVEECGRALGGVPAPP